jgi:hypothetical protein
MNCVKMKKNYVQQYIKKWNFFLASFQPQSEPNVYSSHYG